MRLSHLMSVRSAHVGRGGIDRNQRSSAVAIYCSFVLSDNYDQQSASGIDIRLHFVPPAHGLTMHLHSSLSNKLMHRHWPVQQQQLRHWHPLLPYTGQCCSSSCIDTGQCISSSDIDIGECSSSSGIDTGQCISSSGTDISCCTYTGECCSSS